MKERVVRVSKLSGVVTAGTIMLSGGKVSARATSGYEELMKNVLGSKGQDEVTWFQNLPMQYHGSYMWVE